MLKGASVVPLTVFEYCAKNPPPAVSCFLFVRVLFVFLLLLSIFRLIFLVLLFYSFCRNWGVTLSTRFPLMPALPLRGLGIVLLGLLQPVSFKPPQCFLVLLLRFLMYMWSMSLVQFLEALAVSERGGELKVLLLVCLLPRSLASRVLVQVLQL